MNVPALTDVQIDKEQIKIALKNDREFFIQFFMGELLIFPIPDFHLDIFNRMVSVVVLKLALAIPRGHNKTTLAKLAVVYYFLFMPQRFIVYVSNTAEVAQAACRDIANYLTSDNFFKVFGPIEKIIWQEGNGLYIFKFRNKKCILRALGAGQQVRGLNIDNARPEMAVVDDLEDDENTATPLLRKKLKNWVYGAFFKAFNRWNAKFIWLGNMLNDQSLLKELCDDPEWHSIRLGCILPNGDSLWPDLWPIEEIKKDFLNYKRKGLMTRWFAEMMNLPMPENGAIINPDEINYKPSIVPGEIEYGFVTIDPAISESTSADKVAIVVHGYIDNRWQICDYFLGSADPKLTFEIAIGFCYKWNISCVGIESVAYQKALMFFFEYLLKTLMSDASIEVVKLVTGGKSKTERLLTWTSYLKSKVYAIPEGDLIITEQLLNYDPARTKNDDDLIDACAYGVQMINQYMHMIMNNFLLGKSLPAPRSTYDVCAI